MGANMRNGSPHFNPSEKRGFEMSSCEDRETFTSVRWLSAQPWIAPMCEGLDHGSGNSMFDVRCSVFDVLRLLVLGT
jgi:hypothetical protein